MRLVPLLLTLLACNTDKSGETGTVQPADTATDDTGEARPVDADGDGYSEDEDCDDADASVHPGAAEVCDGLDDDCDGLVDDADDSLDPASTTTWYVDGDADGFGDVYSAVQACVAPSGMIEDGSDCDDSAATVYPGADELCDGVDDDCDGSLPADEGDTDGDGLLDCEDTVNGTAVELSDHAYLVLEGTESLDLAGAHTLEAWFKTDAAMAEGENAVIGKHYAGYYNSWFLGFNSYYGTEYAAQYYIGGPRMTGSVSLNDGAWHHIAGTFDGSTAIMYVDGVEVSRASYSPGATNSVPIMIGGHGCCGGGSYTGRLDEVRLWSVARTADEIADHMSEPLTGTEAGLVAWFDFNDGGGQIATDGGPNGWDATLGSSDADTDYDPVWVDDAPW